jgi:hypothetical protein
VEHFNNFNNFNSCAVEQMNPLHDSYDKFLEEITMMLSAEKRPDLYFKNQYGGYRGFIDPKFKIALLEQFQKETDADLEKYEELIAFGPVRSYVSILHERSVWIINQLP